ncbi:MAG: serpin family protein, partial [Anaerolineales bacterium]
SLEHETKDKIQDLIPSGALNEGTRLVLVNAIYFKGDWLEAFDKTRDAPFHPLDGSQVTVPTMELGQKYFPYADGENWLAVELPYAGEAFAMVIIAPAAGEFDEVQANMDYQSVSTIISSLKTTGMDLSLPRFEFTNAFRLADQLKSLGISDAFSLDRADFSGMTGKRDLYLSDTFHKTYVSVDEAGTTAAAATGQQFQLISGILESIPVHIDRPFIFIIRDLKSGQFLFVGRVLDPRQ